MTYSLFTCDDVKNFKVNDVIKGYDIICIKTKVINKLIVPNSDLLIVLNNADKGNSLDQ